MTHLRDATPADKGTLLRWRNSPEVARYMYTDHVISEEEHERWFARAMSDPAKRYWIVSVDEQDVGLANISDLDRRQGTCSWAFYIAEPLARGRGTGAAVEFLVISYVFGELNLRKLWCEVLGFNRPVVRLHQRFGFQIEGTLRAHVIKDGAPMDVIRMGLLREEWETLKPALEEELKKKGILG